LEGEAAEGTVYELRGNKNSAKAHTPTMAAPETGGRIKGQGDDAGASWLLASGARALISEDPGGPYAFQQFETVSNQSKTVARSAAAASQFTRATDSSARLCGSGSILY
jgi:hypothetical protein